MVRFRDGMRVRVTRAMSPEQGGIKGKTGTVVRLLRRSSEEAWVEMDEPLPVSLRSFPEGDERTRHICLFDDEVEEISDGK